MCTAEFGEEPRAVSMAASRGFERLPNKQKHLVRDYV